MKISTITLSVSFLAVLLSVCAAGCGGVDESTNTSESGDTVEPSVACPVLGSEYVGNLSMGTITIPSFVAFTLGTSATTGTATGTIDVKFVSTGGGNYQIVDGSRLVLSANIGGKTLGPLAPAITGSVNCGAFNGSASGSVLGGLLTISGTANCTLGPNGCSGGTLSAGGAGVMANSMFSLAPKR